MSVAPWPRMRTSGRVGESDEEGENDDARAAPWVVLRMSMSVVGPKESLMSNMGADSEPAWFVQSVDQNGTIWGEPRKEAM